MLMNREFKLEELFGLPIRGKRLTKRNRIPGNIPLVTAGEANQGIAEFIGNKEQQTLHNSLTIDMFGYCFYRDYPYKADDNVLSFGENISRGCGIYLASLISKAARGYGYSQQFRLNSYKNTIISLPVIPNPDSNHKYTIDDIDWNYMQERIAELEQERIAELEQERIAELDAYLIASGLDDYELTDEDKEILTLSPKYASNEEGTSEADCEDEQVKFEKYTLGELFTSSTGDVDLQQKDINGKGEFFINSGVENRGIKGRTDKPARVFPSNTITVDFWGNAYYRNFEYKLATHNHVFSLAGDIIRNRLVGMYIVGILSKLPKLFSFNNMATWNKLKTIEVSLPVTSNGEIDFDYMERYIRAIEKLAIADAVEYKEKMIATAKQVVAV